MGGCGCNSVARLLEHRREGVEYIAVNSDKQALSQKNADKKLWIEMTQLHDRSPENVFSPCEKAVERCREDIIGTLSGADIVFLTCGQGGVAGTGLTPAIASLAREQGILTVGVAATPFRFEGNGRAKLAEAGLARLKERVDTLVVLNNNRLMGLVPRGATMADAFCLSDETLNQSVNAVSDLLAAPGIVRLDFDDLSAAMRGKGLAYIGVGIGEGQERVLEATCKAIDNPLLETKLSSAGTVLVNVTDAGSLSVLEAGAVTERILASVGPNASVVFGTAVDKTIENKVRVVIIATGLS